MARVGSSGHIEKSSQRTVRSGADRSTDRLKGTLGDLERGRGTLKEVGGVNKCCLVRQWTRERGGGDRAQPGLVAEEYQEKTLE